MLNIESIVYAYRAYLHPGSEEGFRALLAMIADDAEVTDPRWTAYMLATVRHECAGQWEPIEEFRKGHGHKYGDPRTIEIAGESYTNTYYGRGYVQLTWLDNYRNMSHFLGMGDDLVITPEKALNRQVAYNIMSYGMRHGVFTGKRLTDYLHDDVTDYQNARRIINGTDQAGLIAGYAQQFEEIIRQAEVVQ